MAVKPVKLSFSAAEYNPQGLARRMAQDMGAVRREYGRLRDIAQKRLARLGASEYAESSAYTYNKDRFIGLREVKNPAQLAKLRYITFGVPVLPEVKAPITAPSI